jgi:23S rRNA pseudouridine1911/1915/1917 synthase
VRQLQARTVKREYLALVYGEIDRGGTVNAPLARDPHNRTKRTVHSMGKEAITHYEVVERFPGVTLLRCKLETGRTHQIRVHMQHIGHPLVGEHGLQRQPPQPSQDSVSAPGAARRDGWA